MKLKKFFLQKLIKSKLKGIPEDQQDMLIELVLKDPDFFEQMAKEMQQKMKEGVDQQTAAKAVFGKYQTKIQEMLKGTDFAEKMKANARPVFPNEAGSKKHK